MRLSPELRDRTKAFASLIVRTFIKLPRKREEVAVLGKQMLRAGTSVASVASHAREASRACGKC
jgi:four helix bundle protein